jgi:membrane protein YdbS with pleckstrin-like domain
MRFVSKVDGWIIPVIVVAIAGMISALIAVMITETPWLMRAAVAAATALVIVLLFSIFTRTHYTIANGELRVVSGPFRRTIPLSEITSMEPSRNPLSSPALSLDRLKVSYGKRKFVLISPADKAGFLSAVERSTRGNET